MAPKIRWWINRDTNQIMAIEKDVFGPLAKSRDEFTDMLRERNVIGMVVEDGDEIIGYIIYELHKRKLHIVHLVVKPSRQRQGIGKMMVDKLVSKLSSHRRTRITLEMRETCMSGQLFFKKMGFLAHEVIRGYYFDTDEDAYCFVLAPSQLSLGII